MIALPFLFGQVLLYQEAYGLGAVGVTVFLYQGVKLLKQLILK